MSSDAMSSDAMSSETMSSFDVLVYGPIFCDLIFTGLPDLPRLGEELFADQLTLSMGGSAIAAAGLRRLGLKVGLIADLGADPFSQLLWEKLDVYGIDRSLIQRHPEPLDRVTVALSYPKDRAFVTCFKTPDQPPDLQTLLTTHAAKHLHIGSFLAAFAFPEAARMAHQAGMTVSFDPGWDEGRLEAPELREFISDVDFFLPSKAELCQMAQDTALESAVQKVLQWMPGGYLVVKDGVRGARAAGQKKGQPIHIPAIAVNSVETTGAGDAFDAGFIFAFLQGLPLETCLEYGVICGGLTTTTPGGTEGFPVEEEIQKWRAKLRS